MHVLRRSQAGENVETRAMKLMLACPTWLCALGIVVARAGDDGDEAFVDGTLCMFFPVRPATIANTNTTTPA